MNESFILFPGPQNTPFQPEIDRLFLLFRQHGKVPPKRAMGSIAGYFIEPFSPWFVPQEKVCCVYSFQYMPLLCILRPFGETKATSVAANETAAQAEKRVGTTTTVFPPWKGFMDKMRGKDVIGAVE